MTSAPLHGDESLTQLRDMVKAVSGENRGLAGEIELNLEQLPITAEIREKATSGYPASCKAGADRT
ncbi:hypothetical protein PWW31_25025 [Vibrio harveyi]|nr:hypothetical protein PWW31_25025 [Vibrio harveyi]